MTGRADALDDYWYADENRAVSVIDDFPVLILRLPEGER